MTIDSRTALNDELRKHHGTLRAGSVEVETEFIDVENISTPGLSDTVRPMDTGSQTFEDDSPVAENLDPWKKRIIRTWLTRWERRGRNIRKLFSRVLPRQLTPQEKAEKEENRQRRLLDRHLFSQAILCKKLLTGALTRRGFCRLVSHEGKERITQEVEFVLCEYSPLKFTYWIDASRIPFGKSVDDLVSDDTCQNVSVSVRHPVRGSITRDPEGRIDACFTVEIAGTNDIPNLVNFRDVLGLIPASAPNLAFVIGKTKNGRMETRSLEELPHLLIGGQTLGGKSNFLNALICSILSRSDTDQVRFLMIDMKGGGIELMHYEGIPHLITEKDKEYVEEVPFGIAQNLDGALAVLDWAATISEKRQHAMMESKIKNIVQWNRKNRKHKMPRIVVVIDELALLMPEDELKIRREVMGIVRVLASTARAAGVHLVAATQSASKTILNETIKVNLPGRIVFSTPDAPSSILLVNDGSAVNLFPAGRAIWKHGTDKFEAQTPFISNADIAQIVKNTQEGKRTAVLSGETVTPVDLISWSIRENESRLTFDKVFYKFRNEISKEKLLTMMQEMDNQVYSIDDRNYVVQPGTGVLPRIVEPYPGQESQISQNGIQDTTEET